MLPEIFVLAHVVSCFWPLFLLKTVFQSYSRKAVWMTHSFHICSEAKLFMPTCSESRSHQFKDSSQEAPHFALYINIWIANFLSNFLPSALLQFFLNIQFSRYVSVSVTHLQIWCGKAFRFCFNTHHTLPGNMTHAIDLIKTNKFLRHISLCASFYLFVRCTEYKLLNTGPVYDSWNFYR